MRLSATRNASSFEKCGREKMNEYTHELNVRMRIVAPEDDTAFEQFQKQVEILLHDIAAIERPSDDAVITAPCWGETEWGDGDERVKVKYSFRRLLGFGYNQVKSHEHEWQRKPASDKQIEYIKGLVSKSANLRKAVEVESVVMGDGAQSITEGLTQGQAGYVIAVLTGKTFEDDWDK